MKPGTLLYVAMDASFTDEELARLREGVQDAVEEWMHQIENKNTATS